MAPSFGRFCGNLGKALKGQRNDLDRTIVTQIGARFHVVRPELPRNGRNTYFGEGGLDFGGKTRFGRRGTRPVGASDRLSGSRREPLGVSGNSWEPLGACGRIREFLGASGRIREPLGGSDRFWSPLWEPLGACGEPLGAYGSLWEALGACGSLWSSLGAEGGLCSPVGASGSMWQLLGLSGSLWEPLITSDRLCGSLW